MLIRKTTVLTGKGAQGHVTLIRVGSSVGVKLILDPPPGETLTLSLAVGADVRLEIPVTGARTETEADIPLEARDEIGAAVFTQSGDIYVSGGRLGKALKPTPSAPGAHSVNVSVVNDGDIANAADTAADATCERAPETGGEAKNAEAEKDVSTNAETIAETSEHEETSEDIAENRELDTVDTDTDNVVKDDSGTVTEIGDESDIRSAFSPFNLNRGENFYRNIRARLEEIMTINPACRELEKMIPESKWVKVYYDDEEYYVVGILTEDAEVKYLGYGVPGVEGIRPPKEAEELCDFLTVENGEEEGYWLMFQNAANGELVKNL